MYLAVILLVAFAAAAPPAQKHRPPDMHMIYNGSHDIVDIAAPFFEHATVIFFVEADVNENGDKDFKGLYVYKKNEPKMILENGQSVTYGKGFDAYFGAKDGIYKYNDIDNTAVKVGTVTDSVVRMAMDTKREFISYLTEDHVLYKFDMSNDESTKIEAVKDARDITYDLSGNMFFYDGSKQMYVFDGENVLKIEGLPSDAKKIFFNKVVFFITDVFAIVDGTTYKLAKDGTSQITDVGFRVIPTACALDYVTYQYYGFNKKIYKFNMTIHDFPGLAHSRKSSFLTSSS